MTETEAAPKSEPESHAAERAVLGSCLVQPESIVEAQALLSDEDFEVPQHQSVFRGMVTLAAAGSPIDLVTLEAELTSRGWWKALGLRVFDRQPLSWLVETAGSVPTAGNVRHYAEIVARQSAIRKLKQTCGKAAALADENPEEAQRLILESQRLLTEVQRGRSRPGIDIADVVPKVIAEFEARQEARRQGGARVIGLTTGLTALDYMTGGLRDETLTILAARTSLGKTAFGSQIALLGAIFDGVPALAFSLEMGAMELGERFFARLALVASDRLRSGELSRDDWGKIHRAGSQMCQRGLVTISNTRTLPGMWMEARAFRVRHPDKRIFILVDYLQLARTGQRGRTREEELAEISGDLKDMAVEFKCPVLALAQLNRGPEAEEREPRVSDLRGSGAIEQDADLILMITRKREAIAGICTIHVLKSRNGPTGDVDALWEGAMYQLRDPDYADTRGRQ